MTDQPPAYQPPSNQPPASPPPSYPPASYPPQSYPNAPAYGQGYAAPSTSVPGRTLGIVSLIGSIVLSVVSIVWLILGIVALVQSRKAGRGNGFALAAIIISAVAIIVTVVIIILAVVATSNLVQFCATNGPGTYDYNGTTITCS